ncbi:TetR/AcrR family transcriptional repressor of nem operon [Silvibacterium bohemicum]|uniref:TetR/AcrR family transcriptional repressor of nem operon n=1 Tax=Silvibacterium bohemicum TaxID=1577686 RepID=A0A841K5E6_9BACT|nr:TetR/AcrR family transcriptional repressor of nem operon [Silvibacterium bohemicum]
MEKSSLYGHFSTKEALAVAAFEYAWKEVRDARLARMDTVANAIEKLRIHVDNFVSTPSFPGGCPLINAGVDSDDGNPTLKKMVRAAQKEWRLYLERVVKEGQDRREIRAKVQPEDIASFIIASLEGAVAMDRLDKKVGYLDRVCAHLNLYLDTVAYRPG